MNIKKITIASDHAGYEIKIQVIKFLHTLNFLVFDQGVYNNKSIDYPDPIPLKWHMLIIMLIV
jgi:ribose 5-phosphate isomerase B